MKVSQDNFESGAQSLSFELSDNELAEFISALQKLARGDLTHFHFRSDFSKPGIGDIEFSCSGVIESAYLTLEI